MGERTARWICAVAATALIGAGASGCSDLDSHALLEVDARVALADQAVHMRVSGLSPGGEVTVTSRAVDRKGMPWHGEATFRADRHGLVTLDTATPTSGTYRRPDAMGLFWSMVPRTGDPDHTSFVPPASRHHAYDVTLTATAHGPRAPVRLSHGDP
ncbi:acyl-CoA thioesterase/BAAT N-terminal domain-containing protein [Streptomyces sp. NPDC052287]|uniref:acyl-CoA thioesterase/BAAT N-terminal domain-containing protein n=1 Tax=Streptomyces sp. NPDC052287 TaxID=3154950 RepID=UPI003447EEB2